MKKIHTPSISLFFLILLFNIQVFAQIAGNPSVCSGQIETYTTSSSSSTLNWMVTGAKSFTQNGSSITVEWGTGGTGIVNLSTYDQNNAPTGTYSLSVAIATTPNPIILSGFITTCFDQAADRKDSCLAACQFRPMNYSAPFVSGSSYLWEIDGNGIVQSTNANEAEVIWQTLGVQYIRLTVTNSSGCANTFEKCVRVGEAPHALIGNAASNGAVITVCKNSPVYLEDLSTGSVNRSWDFGDGNFSDAINPTHYYPQAGTYQVILTANNGCYCLNSDTIAVTVQDSEAPEIICPSVVCENDTVSYSSPSACSGFAWSATNGNIIGNNTNNTVEVVWNNHVGYLQLDATNCNNGCTAPAIEKIAVITDSIPIQGASSACIGNTYTYSIAPIPGSVYNWSVDQNLSTKVEQDEYSITVKIEGSGTINLNYTNSLLGCMGSTSLYVAAKKPLSIAMSPEVCKNDKDTFIIDSPADWRILDTSGTVIYSDTNTTEVYFDWSIFSDGDYTLLLEKRNSYCNDFSVPFTILPAPATPNLINGLSAVCAASAYAYSVAPKSGYRVEWEVEGGSPFSATGNNVTVNWDGTPPYILRVAYRQLASPHCLSSQLVDTLASINNGSQSILGVDSICGGDSMTLELDFIADNVEWKVVTANGASILTDRFQNEIKVQTNAASTQIVKFRAEGFLCGTFFSMDKDVFVQSFQSPTISFSNANPCPNTPVRFSSNLSNVTWEIGALVFNDPTPTVSFPSASSAAVKVTAHYSGPNGCSVERVNIAQLIVQSAPKALISAIIDTNSSYCEDTLSPITLEVPSQGNGGTAYTYQWLKDGVLLGATGSQYITSAANAHGNYTVMVTNSSSGCSSVSNAFTIGNCDSLEVPCNDISLDTSISVDIILASASCNEFFVSQVNSTGGVSLVGIRSLNPQLEPLSLGAYGVGFRLPAGTHSLLFDGFVTNNTDTFCFTKIVKQTVAIEPDFEVVEQACSASGLDQFEFINNSSYTGATPAFSWNFGGGSRINPVAAPNPIVEFPAGTYTVTLIAGSAGCSFSQDLVAKSPTVANFSSPTQVCQQEPVDFSNQSVGNIVEYHWQFGAKEIFEENPKVTFVQAAGNNSTNYSEIINLIILDQDGCRETSSQSISILGNQFNGKIQPQFPSAICEGDSILFDFSQQGSFSNTPVYYQWSNQETTPNIQVSQTGNYQLSLTDNYGCRFVSEQINVQVNTAPNPIIVGKQTFCEYETVRLSTLGHQSYGMEWKLDGNRTFNFSEKFEQRLPSGTYLLSVDATSTTTGCVIANSPFPVTVVAAPAAPVITSSLASPLCEGVPIRLTASPAGGAFYWNTGQTGNSITQTLAGNYTVHRSDASGCRSSSSIDIHPLPDFSNFMTGCYCLPLQSPPDLLGIPNMASYQWKKNGIAVLPPDGQMMNLPALAGSFELIAVTDSGCVDTAGVLDISIGGCEPCVLSLSDVAISCARISGDSAFYDFSILADLSPSGSVYALTQNLLVNNQPASILQVQPSSISGNNTSITGTFVTVNSRAGDSICLQMTASNPAINCTAESCTTLAPLACNFVPAIHYTVNPYTCQLQMIQAAAFGTCAINDSVVYSWTVTQGRSTYTGTGMDFMLDSLNRGDAQICLEMRVFQAADSSFCIKDTCISMVVPDCSCRDNCTDLQISSAQFERFVQQGTSCVLEFKVVLDNPSNVPVSINYFKANAGTVLSVTPIASAPNTTAYLVQYYPEQPSTCSNQCFELFLNNGGTNCCLNFCVDLPQCKCDLRLSKLGITCHQQSASNGGWFDFSIDVDLAACNGFTYDASNLSVTLGGQPVIVVDQQGTTLNNGTQRILGTVDLTGLVTGNPLCFDLTASLGGLYCSDQICGQLPPVPCELEPSFTTAFDPNTCTYTLTSTSTANACIAILEDSIRWDVTFQGITYTQKGRQVTFSNMRDDEVEVCMTVTATDYSGNSVCSASLCETERLENCICKNDCEGEIETTASFDRFLLQNDSCVIRFTLDIRHTAGRIVDLSSIFGQDGVVVSSKLLSNVNGIQQYEIDFYPKQPWEGGEACFELFMEVEEGAVCCQIMCIELPKCDCELQLNNLVLDCTGPYGTVGDFTFSLDAILNGVAGYSYNSTVEAFVNGLPITLSSFQPNSLSNGANVLSGSFSYTPVSTSDVLCITVTSSLAGGKTCIASVCKSFPDNPCEIIPSYSYSMVGCDIVVTNTSQIGSCTYVDTSTITWFVDHGLGANILDTGNFILIPRQFANSGERVCMTITGINYTQDSTCLPRTYCSDIFYTPCPEDPDYDGDTGGEEPFLRLKGEEEERAFVTYPNPAKNVLFVEWKEVLNESVEVLLIDHNSKVVYRETKVLEQKKMRLPLNNYANGVYILEIRTKEQTNREKIVLLR